MPPLKDVLDALQHAVLPGAGGAALVMCAFLLLGRWAGALGSAAAVAFGFVWGNFTLDKTAAPTWVNTSRLIPWSPEADAPGYQWLARAALVLVVVGLVSRWIGLIASRALPERGWWGASAFVWAPRVVAVFVVSGWLSAGEAAKSVALLRPQIAAITLLMWVALDGIARNGAGATLAGYSAAMLMSAAAVLIHAHSARFMELAVVLGSAMFGIAVASALVKPDAQGQEPDTSGAIPAVVAFLPGLLLGARPSLAENNVPGACFWLVVLAPLMLLAFLLPAITRKTDWKVPAIRAALVLLPLVVAVALAAHYETIAVEEQW
jgi:hypothetical protein